MVNIDYLRIHNDIARLNFNMRIENITLLQMLLHRYYFLTWRVVGLLWLLLFIFNQVHLLLPPHQ